jgi:ABC-type histidine transport system ATPase subunit
MFLERITDIVELVGSSSSGKSELLLNVISNLLMKENKMIIVFNRDRRLNVERLLMLLKGKQDLMQNLIIYYPDSKKQVEFILSTIKDYSDISLIAFDSFPYFEWRDLMPKLYKIPLLILLLIQSNDPSCFRNHCYHLIKVGTQNGESLMVAKLINETNQDKYIRWKINDFGIEFLE